MEGGVDGQSHISWVIPVREALGDATERTGDTREKKPHLPPILQKLPSGGWG